MARKTPSRKEMRRMAEAAENRAADEAADEKASPKKKAAAKKKTPRKRASRKKTEKAAPRKLMMWAVYNGSLKEEGRYTYAEKDKAEEKLESLRAKATKKLYFLQPIKVPLADAAAAGVILDDEDTAVAVKKKKKGEGEEE